MESVLALISFVLVIAIFAVIGSVSSHKGGRTTISSAKFPPPFSSSLSKQEILTAVVGRLENMQSLRFKWKVMERVDKIGRLQAMINVPYNVSGEEIKVSFLLNLSATAREAGGCGVEWSYVMMSPISATPPEIALWEEKIYKQTTLEIRAALFSAQGDADVADFVQDQAKSAGEKSDREDRALEDKSLQGPASLMKTVISQRMELEAQARTEPQAAKATTVAAAKGTTPASPLDIEAPTLPDIVNAELQSLGSANTDLAKSPMHVASSIPGTALPDLAGEELTSLGSGTTGDPSLMQVPEVQTQMPEYQMQMPEYQSQVSPTNSAVPEIQSQMPNEGSYVPEVQSQMPTVNNSVPDVDSQLGNAPNTMNFSPSGSGAAAGGLSTKESKCPKCSQVRDPSFNFCLYCGHTDS